jgi:predicted lipoprotein with Yx(FWY)xxD motif
VVAGAEEVTAVHDKNRARRLLLPGLLAGLLAIGGALLPAAAGSVTAITYPMPPPVYPTPPPVNPTPTPAATLPPVGPPASVALGMATSPALGPILTDPSGMTLYTLSSDPLNGSACTGGCLSNWPPLLLAAGGTVSGPSGVSLALGTFTRSDNGTTQGMLNGHALYTFAGDSAPGQTNGEGIVAFGGTWHVASAASSFLGSLSMVSLPGSSTVPANGDINPYGVAVVPRSIGHLVKGDILVSNFNNKANLQGTGTTIVQLSPSGARHLFASITPAAVAGRCPGGVGLSTALVALSSGWVIVGSLPTKDGTAATASAGCLIVLNPNGHVVETFHGGPINGPWDMTALDGRSVARLFVTDVLNGTVKGKGKVVHGGTVVRLVLKTTGVKVPTVVSETVIGSGFAERTDPGALVIGPTGLGLDANGTLYVADTLNSRIAAIGSAASRTSSAGTGSTVTSGHALNAPLGLTIAPNGDILTVNGRDGNIVETTPGGVQVATKTLDGTGGGGGLLFGLAIRPGGTGVWFVDDGTNTLALLH